MQKDDYNHKLQQIMGEEVKNGICTPIEDSTLNDFKKFQDSLRRIFKEKFARNKDTRNVSNQPGHINTTAKAYKSKACVCYFFTK